MFKGDRFWDPGLLQRTLAEQAKDLASLTTAFGGGLPTGPENFDALRNPLFERYRQLFMPPGLAAAGDRPANPGAAFLRYQQAMQEVTAQLSAIAMNAGERLAARAAVIRSVRAEPPHAELAEELRDPCVHRLHVLDAEQATSHAALVADHAEVPTRLPHERDEKAGAGVVPPRPKIKRAYQDLASGQVDTDCRNTATQVIKKKSAVPAGATRKR